MENIQQGAFFAAHRASDQTSPISAGKNLTKIVNYMAILLKFSYLNAAEV